MKPKLSLLLSAFCLLLSIFALSAWAQDTVLAIRGGTVHTVSGPDIPNGTVVVRNGKIAAVGPGVSVPAGARTVDARGLHVYPGMIDAGASIGLTEISSVPATVDTAELGEFNPQLLAASAIHPASEHIPVTRANGITTVLSSPLGGVISGQSALINLAGWTIEEMAVRKSLGMTIQFPTIRTVSRDPETFQVRRTPYSEAKKTYDRQMTQLREWLEKARHYAQARAAEAPDLQRDLKLEALAPLVKGEQPALVSVGSARDIRNAIEFAEKERIKVILAGADDAWKEVELLKKKNIPVILGPTLSLPDREDDPYDRPFTTPSDLYKAGVKFAFASQSASSARDRRNQAPMVSSRNLPYQAAMAVAFGLPWEEAIKAVTLYPAQILGVNELGSIEVGKIANLIVTDGDPLEARTQLKHLIIHGRLTSAGNKHKQLYEKYLARP